jgi:hypothetical protein
MKKLLITAAALVVSLNVFAQGRTQSYVDFRNTAALTDTRQRVYDGTYGGGTANYASAADGFQVGLYWAADGTTDESMFSLVGAGASVINNGLFTGGNRSIPSATGNAMFQVRGWTAAFGTDYATGFAAGAQGGANKVGKGTIFRATGLNDPDQAPTPLPPGAITQYGVIGLALTPVPEPSAIVLGIMGAGALLLLRRRK